MKDIGIKVEHIALMYAILPFTIFLAPPLVGFLADKLGKLNFLAANDCAEVLYVHKYPVFIRTYKLLFIHHV